MPVDEGAQVVRRAIEPRRRIGNDAVVAPAEGAAEFVDRHHLDERDAERLQRVEAIGRRRPGAGFVKVPTWISWIT